jgi:hypothetical protein
MELIPIVELGVSEAYMILTGRFGVTNLPPLESIENEDWGRDYLLCRFLELPPSVLAEAGLCISVEDGSPPPSPGGGGSSSKSPGPPVAT